MVRLLLCCFLLPFLVLLVISFFTCALLAAHSLYFKPECIYFSYVLPDPSPPGKNGTQLCTSTANGTHLGGKFPLPLSGDLRGGVDLLLAISGLRRLVQLLSDTGQRGLLAHQQSGLQLLPQQEIMFGLFHLIKEVSISLLVQQWTNKGLLVPTNKQ